ncbi:CPBP family intramembrane glutamic endopeptidase [Methylobacterium planeticum]|uniref:CPBP family intramembrane metalloprotease n=1 Tax=Methylobacterium planeticum TaxID=2615211 RepID=A0A6N6MR00_9HYPH|nr:CPBP family intramembrane glutamic endopeptidase [Methylobacterium planeticum]KAB1073896.1 CPBP family intramembrane metalloprotease [Methylobacterium planeticum]
MHDDAAGARSASPARAVALACLWVSGLGVAVLLYLAAASLMAILAVRVGADLLDGIDPLLDLARRPSLGPARLATRELAVDILRQVFLAALVLGAVIWREPAQWRRRLALDRAAPNGMRARNLLLLLLLWPIVHIAWVSGTAEAFGAAFGRGVYLSPSLSPAAVTAWLAYLVVLAPAAEEILMRGEIFASARRFLSPAATILVTAALFALAHISAWGLARPVSLLPLALMLGWLRWRTGRLWPCIALHGWSNLSLVAYVLWPSPG